MGVGQGLSGELLTELRVLLSTECGHWGGPMRELSFAPASRPDMARVRKHGIFVQTPTFLPASREASVNGAVVARERL